MGGATFDPAVYSKTAEAVVESKKAEDLPQNTGVDIPAGMPEEKK